MKGRVSLTRQKEIPQVGENVQDPEISGFNNSRREIVRVAQILLWVGGFVGG